jgi:pilus assembly protein Flp/PilA
MSKFVSRFLKDESGATAIEYGLIAALIAVALVTAMGFLGEGLENAFKGIQGTLEGETPPAAP